ncbi:MAG: exonuclease subunit SbcD, partial [Chloroflexota bacterium]
MRILHTSDWHIGKHLGRYDRAAEFRDALDEVHAIAEAQAVDLVIVSGDLWDRSSPPTDALGDGIEALMRLADNGRRAVVAIAGNH